MTNDAPRPTVVYCRVSDIKQKTEGTGLASQEYRCRQYAESRNYHIEKVFHDDVTGGGDYSQRPAMNDLLRYLGENSEKKYIVLFDDISRFSRDVHFYWELIQRLEDYDARPDSPNFSFEQSPEGRLKQTVTVAAGAYQRESNSRQVRQKQQAKMEQGYWQFPVPKGYEFVKTKYLGGLVMRQEPAASIVQEALEGFANGRFETQAEVQRFLNDCPDYPRGVSGKVSGQHAHDVLTHMLYAGYYKYPNWGIGLTEAKHEALISYETYLKNQKKLSGRAHAPARKNINEDFPLRGFIDCECGKPLTACWSKGRSKHYAYYYCQSKTCSSGPSIKRETIHGEFEELLKSLTPRRELLEIATDYFKRLWDYRQETQSARLDSLEHRGQKIERDINKLLDRVIDAEDPRMQKRLEQRVRLLDDEKVVVQEKIVNCGRPLKTFEVSYRTAMTLLSKPHEIWASGVLANQRAVLKLVFGERLIYVHGEGYRTAKTTLPFNVLGGFGEQNMKMVGRAGFEPATNWLKANCSTN